MSKIAEALYDDGFVNRTRLTAGDSEWYTYNGKLPTDVVSDPTAAAQCIKAMLGTSGSFDTLVLRHNSCELMAPGVSTLMADEDVWRAIIGTWYTWREGIEESIEEST
jgi:hypothetical protein